ncbi:MAG TPA: hypothetical protein VF798_09385 [Burkholderiaceae bacterium]
MRKAGHADADAAKDLTSQLERFRKCPQRTVADLFDVFRLYSRSKQQGKFVAAYARHRVAGTHRALHAHTGIDNQAIARIVARRVVDFLEMIEIEQGQEKTCTMRPGLAQIL